MAKSYYLYISSKNRNENEKKYNFRVRLNNPIVCNRDEGLNISVCGFSMLNSDYNCKNFSFTITKYSLVGIYENSYTFNIPDGNYSYLSLMSYLNSNLQLSQFIKIDYIKERNSFKFTKNDNTKKYFLTPFNCNKILGLETETEITTSGIEGGFINMVNYSHIIIKSNNIDFEDNAQDNISYKSLSMGISNILFIWDKQDIQPFQLISYRNFDKSDNFSYNINNNIINFIDLMLYNEKNEILTDTDDYILILKITINKKEINLNYTPIFDDIRFILMSILFNNEKKNNLIQ
jgi:hypothetical protein